jgi:hypothetical protein
MWSRKTPFSFKKQIGIGNLHIDRKVLERGTTELRRLFKN